MARTYAVPPGPAPARSLSPQGKWHDPCMHTSMPGMKPNPKGLLLQLAGLVLATVIALGLQARERATQSDNLYGYTVAQSTAEATCGFDYIELGDAGQPVILAPGHPKADADDGAAVVRLRQPFEFYQLPSQALVVSGNGYLATADSLEAEDGSDFSNDCRLPERADNPSATHNRIYVYHDDLRPRAGGEVRQAFFANCPRAGAGGINQACTVVEWDGFERASPVPSSQPLRAQAVLYHGSHEIALQYSSLDDSRAAQATVGLQGFDGRTARVASCNSSRAIASRQAVCFFDPRYPPVERIASRSARD